MKKSIILMVMIPILLMGIANVYSQGKWEVTTFTDVSVDKLPIGGELVDYEITIEYTIYSMEGNNGVTHTRMTVNLYGEGDGRDTGNKYIFDANGVEIKLDWDPGLKEIYTFPRRFWVVCEETKERWSVLNVEHYTINPDGIWLADIFIVKSDIVIFSW